ncbi:MAG: hypothetical protein IJG60_01615 [Thermoguttaceae bacterium]|nr:hypothetical protein [Thermoguttaceae bacterium]
MLLNVKSFPGYGIVFSAGLSLLFLAAAVPLGAQEAPPAAPPAPAPPDTTAISAAEGAEFLANYNPSKSYSRLLFPNVAAMVGLTPTQQAEVSRLMTERSAKLAAAVDQSQWPEIVQKSEDEIKAILKPEQLKLFDQAVGDKLITIRFSKEPWENVLKWFAAELGLQLVMNAPPPGTFNYNDKNSYTPREAFDILNGRLQFQGYTLLRTGNMLYVHNFKDGPIPMQFLPKVTLEELPEQSRFSYVALTLPLAQRALPTVLTAIKPFQGPYNSTQALTGNALLIVDSVNALREIVPVALAVVNPPLPPALSVPVWQTYELTNVSPSFIEREVKRFVPSALSTANEVDKSVSYLAIPSVHAVIKGLIDRLDKSGDPSKALTVAAYPLDDITNMSLENTQAVADRLNVPIGYLVGSNLILSTGQEIVEGLQTLCPDATIVLNEMTKQIMVVAMPDDQEKIREAVNQLKEQAGQAQKETFGVYSLGADKKLTESEVRVLQAMLPRSQVSYDKEKNSLLVVGPERDQKTAAAAAETIEKHYAELAEERLFVSFSMTAKQLALFNEIFVKIADKPEMEGIVPVNDPHASRVGFWGTVRQLESVRSIVEQLTGRQLPPVTPPQDATPADALPPEEIPGDETDSGIPAGGSVRRTLNPDHFRFASDPFDSPETDLGGGSFMKIFRLEKADPATVTELLRNTVPGIEIDEIAETKSLVVYGSKKNLLSVQQLITELEQTEKVEIKAIPYTNTFPMSSLPLLQQEEPDVHLSTDPLQKQFLLVGPADAVRRLSDNIASVMEVSPQSDESLKYWGAERDIPSEVVDYIRHLFPRLTVTYNSDEKQFTLIGTAADQEGALRIISEAEESLPELEETRYYLLEHRVSDEFLDRVRGALPEANEVERSDDNPKVLMIKARPDIQNKVMDELNRLQEEFPESETKVFASYTLESELKSSFDTLLPEFEKENGEVRLIGYENEILGIWAFPGQHAKIKAMIGQLRDEGRSEDSQKDARFYRLKYADGATLIPLVKGVVPAAAVTLEPGGERLAVSGTKKAVSAAISLLESLDVKPVGSDAERFVRIEPRRLSPQTLSTMIRTAFPKLTPSVDPATGSLIVDLHRVPKEDLLAFVDLADPETPSPLEPTLKIYSFEKKTTQAAVDTLKKLVPDAQLILQQDGLGMLAIAKPAELAVIDSNIGQIEGAVAPAEPFVKFYAFDREPTAATVTALTTSLKKIAPEAVFEIDRNSRQLMVIATASDQEKIEESVKSIIETFNPVDLKMVAYPVQGMDITALSDTLKGVYPDIKIETDPVGRRLLIWATLDQHVRLSEEIAEVNAKSDPDAPDYEGPKSAVYNVRGGGQARMLLRLVQTMFPGAEVYTESVNPDSGDGENNEETYWRDRLLGEQKVTVLAPAREQALIAEIFEQYQNPSNLPEKRIETWPIGSLEPDTVEAFIQNLLPAAVTLSPPNIATRQRRNRRVQENASFFRVDPRGRTVSVYAEERDLEKVKDLLGQLAESEQASEMASKAYRLASPIARQLSDALEEQAPEARFITPDPYQIIALATEADQAKIERFLSALTDLETSETHFNMKSVFLPEGCMVPRDTVVHYLTSQFLREKGYAYSAAHANQIILWGTPRVLEEMQKFIDETCNANQEESYRSYPVDHLTPAEAAALLQKLVPNTTVTPDAANKKITVLGSPFVQKRVETALAEIDAKRTGGAALTTEYYSMAGMAPGLFPSVYTALVRQFPQAVIVPDAVYGQFAIVATEETQEQIAGFFDSMKAKQLEAAPVFEVYGLTQTNCKTLIPILAQSVPGAIVFPGKAPSELYAFAKPEDQDKVRSIVAKVDTIDENAEGMQPKVYRVDARHAAQAAAQLAPSLPGAQLYPLTGGGVLMWGSPADHQRAEAYFGTFAEAYPEPVVRRYQLKHIKYAAAAAFFARAFPQEALVYPDPSGDLFAEASEIVQEKIAEALAEIDVPQSDEARPTAQAYNISELPRTSQPTAVTAITRICPDAVFMPTATPGYFVIYAKPSDQGKIAEILGKMIEESPNRLARMEVYSLRNNTYTEVARVIAEIAPTAILNPGKEPNQIGVWASDSDQAKIANIVGKLNEPVAGGSQPRVYHLSKANLVQAQTAIRSLYPTQIQSIIDPASRTLTVNAAPLHQEKVAQLIAEIERNDAATQPLLRVFSMTGIAQASVLPHLNALYASDPDFRANYDQANQTLVVHGSPEQINAAADLITQIRQSGLSDSGRLIKTYTMRNSLTYYTLRNIFQRQGRTVEMTPDYATGKLLVVADAKDHLTIENVLQALAPEPTVLAVYDLEELDPQTAASIISNMLENDGTYVDVQPDDASDKLYIRATEKKQREIRQFLIEAGETNLRTSQAPGAVPARPGADFPVQGSGTLRTIHFDGDLREAVEKAEAGWPRSNPIRIIQGNEKIIQTKENPDGVESAQPEEEPLSSAGAKEPASSFSGLVKNLAVLLASQTEFAGTAPARPAADPIYAVLNPDHSVTLTSNDVSALDDFESRLLTVLEQCRRNSAGADEVDFFDRPPADFETRSEKATKNIRALARQHRHAAQDKLVMEDRDYAVYKVENVSVDQMIARLRVYMSDKLTAKAAPQPVSGRNGVTVTPLSTGPRLRLQPDNEMNTIMVIGKKSDRDEAGAMIALLDKAELFPQPITKPVKIPVRNTSVVKMAQQVLNVFQLKFRSTRLPGGLTPRILPNTDANVLEVFAPKELAEEIAQYVKETDEEILEDKTSQVKIVPLEEINAMVFQKYIDNLKGPQSNYILVSPYTINPQYTRQPRQF